MLSDKWGRPERDDEHGKPDRPDEARPTGPQPERDDQGWRDPRDWIPLEDRPKYFRGHKPMTDDRLEAENAARGITYEYGPHDDPDDLGDLDQIADQPTSPITEPDQPDHAEDSRSEGRHAAHPAKPTAEPARPDRPDASVDDQGRIRLNDPAHDGPWFPQRPELKEQPVRFGDRVVNEEDDKRSLRQRVNERIVRNSEDIIDHAEQGANRAQLAMNPRPTGAYTEIRPEPTVVADVQRGEASLGTLVASGIATVVAASVIVDRIKAKPRAEGIDDVGNG